MKIAAKALIEDLIQSTQSVLNQAEQYLQEEEQVLNKKPDARSWSILECIEHLNRYGDFYLPEIQQRIRQAKAAPSEQVFKSGLLGDYFAQSMLPKEKLNKMKTFKSMNPVGSALDKNVIEKFIGQQKQMLSLLDQARAIDLQKTKTSISISKWIRLRLGDTFRVVIYHNERHMQQASRACDM